MPVIFTSKVSHIYPWIKFFKKSATSCLHISLPRFKPAKLNFNNPNKPFEDLFSSGFLTLIKVMFKFSQSFFLKPRPDKERKSINKQRKEGEFENGSEAYPETHVK